MSEQGDASVMHEVDLPLPVPGRGEIRIAQSVAGINFIDVYERSGTYKRDLPFVGGREGAGIVDALGSDVSGVAIGDRVAYLDVPAPGGYAEYVVLPAAQSVPVPVAIDDRTACAVMLQGVTAHYLSASTYAVQPGDTVLVHAAAGGVGRLLVQLAKRAQATVIATAGGAEKVALVRSAGADHVIDYADVDFAPEVMRLTGNHGVAAAYDSVGRETWERSLSVVQKRGYLVLYGASSGPVPPIDPLRLMTGGSIFVTRPTLGDYKRTRAELLARTGDIFAAIQAGQLDVRIGATYALHEAAQAHHDLEARKTTGKLLLLP